MNSIRLLNYQPDKSASYRQAMRGRTLRRAWSAIQDFLASSIVLDHVADVCLIAYRATQWDDPTVANRCIDIVRAQYGPPHDDGAFTVQSWPDASPLPGGLLRWRRTSNDLPELVDFVASREPWPKQTVGPVELSFSIGFRWDDRIIRGTIPVPQSTIGVTLGRRPFVQPSLWFPYGADDSGLATLLTRAQSVLPFTLLERHFRVASPTSDGFRFATVDQPLLSAT